MSRAVRDDEGLEECCNLLSCTMAILTEGGGGETGYGAGHEEVGNLPQSEQSSGVVPLVHLFLDQSF